MLSVVIPVYNEKKTVLDILEKVKAASLKKEIIVVDDGSTDGTSEILEKNSKGNFILIKHPSNMGKGSAIRTALKHTSGDMIIIQDADLEYNPADYVRLVQPIITGEAGAVYGSRNLGNNKKGSALYYWGGMFLSSLANFLYGLSITDEATCYKIIRTDILKDLDLECRHFEFCPEVTAKLGKRKIKIVELPISYIPRLHKDGKKIGVKDGIVAAWILIKYKFIK